MKYRIRMIRLKWWMLVFDPAGNPCHDQDQGPFDKIGEAVAAAEATEFADWDKG